MTDEKIKHLEFIQNIITRMNTNSFQIKGLAITLVAAFLAVYVSNNNPNFILIAILPLVLFWFLDAYYLVQERRYISLYNKVRQKDSNIDLFDMNIDADEYKIDKLAFESVLFASTMWTLYLLVSFLLLGVYFYLV